ncbi:MAG: hypothetical protein GXO78_10495 [Calditrichaeota bacterium]|nr:hypothetical protein [Calditrichota bacterium]
MRRLQIAVYHKEDDVPRFTVKIPAIIDLLDASMIPEVVKKRMDRQGISVEQLLEKIKSARVPGPILEFEDQENRIVITLIEDSQ